MIDPSSASSALPDVATLPSSRDRWKKQDWLLLILLALLGGGVWQGVLRNQFVAYDDNYYVTENPHVRTGLTVENLRYAWTTFDLGNWVPLTWISFQIDAALFGVSAPAFHAVNLLLHVANVLLLFIVLRRMTGSAESSALVAALFAVHPLRVESVAWVSERKDVLSTFWLLVTLWIYERYAAHGRWFRYAALATTFLLSLLSKPMFVTLPVLLCLLDFWPLQRWAGGNQGEAAHPYPSRSIRWLVIEKLPLLALSAGFGIVTIIAQRHAEYVSSLARLPLPYRLANAVQAYAWYVQKTFWPTGLSVFYPHPVRQLDWLRISLSAALLLAISVWAVRGWRRRPWRAIGWMWFLISLLPVIGLLQVGMQSWADRYSYVPQIGLLIVVVWETRDWLGKKRGALSQGAWIGGWLVVFAVLSLLTLRQINVWRTTESLWLNALRVDPDNWLAHYELGNERLAQERYDQARREFLTAATLQPGYANAFLNLGALHQRVGELEPAARYYRHVLQLDKNHPRALYNLALVLHAQGSDNEAEALLARLLAREPGNVPARMELGTLFLESGRFERASEQFEQVLRDQSDNAGAHRQLALVLLSLGRKPQAKDHLLEALRIDPEDSGTHYNLAILLEELGDVPGAIDHLEQAARLDPNDPDVRVKLQSLRSQNSR